MTARTDGERRVVTIARAPALDAFARRDIAERLAAAAARVGEATTFAREIGGARWRRRRTIRARHAFDALALSAGADRRALGAVAVRHACHARLSLRIAERAIGAGAIG